MQAERFFAVLFFALIATALLSFFSPIPQIVHGFTQYFFGGNSQAKTLAVIGFFAFNALISFIFLKTKAFEKIKEKEKVFLKIFIASALIAFVVGAMQFLYFANTHESIGPFATMIKEVNYTNWESSSLAHNHFPKTALYYFFTAVGIEGGSFDDGKPLAEIYPNPLPWSLVLIALTLISLIAGILHINSRIEKTKAFDYLVFIAAFFGLISTAIDGGITSDYAFIAFFLFLLYYSRNYLNTGVKTRLLAPLGIAGFSAAFIPLLFTPYPVSSASVYSVPLIVGIGVLHYFAVLWKEKKIEKSIFNVFLAVLLIFSVSGIIGAYADFAFGRSVKGENGIYVYGIPQGTSVEELNGIVSEYLEVESSYLQGWNAYFEGKALKEFRTKELEQKLKEKLKGKGYLYAEQVTPKSRVEVFKILWLDGQGNEGVFEDFLGNKVLEEKYIPEENATELKIDSNLVLPWQMLSTLTYIREQGIQGKVLLLQ